MSVQPSGTITLLFADVEGSTRTLQRLGTDRYRVVIERHRELLHATCAAHGGYVVDDQGDGCFVTFPSAAAAVEAAAEAQRLIAAEPWPPDGVLRTRMGIHTGEPLVVAPKYVGMDVHRAQRVMSVAFGGQVLVSQSTRDLLDQASTLRDLGEHRLKDLPEPMRLYQLEIDGLPAEFPPLPSAAAPPTLPVQPTGLIGRRNELRELDRLLRARDVRLLTLTGAAGIGKTRLALEAAAELAADLADGVRFVPLAPLRDAGAVVPAIVAALSLRAPHAEPLLDGVVEALRDRELLLVLDNFEHVADAAPAVAALLAGTRRLKVLATSRVRLRISAERVYQVPPLATPADAGLAELAQSDAALLFIERAQAADTAFRLTDANVAAIAGICVRLDGLPLALELAAARVRELGARELLERLADRLDLLGGGMRDLDERQRTLRGTIDWSHALLRPGEQELFADLAVFAGGWTLDAAEAVGGAAAAARLGALVDASLVNRSEDDRGRSRYWMFETIGDYARERLVASGREPELRRAHAAWVAAIAEEAESELEGPAQLEWLTRLERERDNIRAALDWSASGGDVELGVRIVGALWYPWTSFEHLAAGRRWAELLLPRLAGDDSVAHARLLHAAAHFAEGLDADESLRLSTECLDLSRRIGYRRGVALSLVYLSEAAVQRGDEDAARELAAEAVQVAEGLADPSVLGVALAARGAAAFARGDDAEAVETEERVVALARASGDAIALARALANLAYAHMSAGDYRRAAVLAEESVAIQREVRTKAGAAWASATLGQAALFLGDVERADEHLRAALAATGSFGHARRTAGILYGLAAVAGERGDAEAAARLWFAACELARGGDERLTGPEREIERRYLAPRVRTLSESTVDRLRREAAELTLDEAVELALADESAAVGAHTGTVRPSRHTD